MPISRLRGSSYLELLLIVLLVSFASTLVLQQWLFSQHESRRAQHALMVDSLLQSSTSVSNGCQSDFAQVWSKYARSIAGVDQAEIHCDGQKAYSTVQWHLFHNNKNRQVSFDDSALPW